MAADNFNFRVFEVLNPAQGNVSKMDTRYLILPHWDPEVMATNYPTVPSLISNFLAPKRGSTMEPFHQLMESTELVVLSVRNLLFQVQNIADEKITREFRGF